MKKSILLLALLLAGIGASAQSKFGPDSVKCWESTQIYYQLYKSKQYVEAYDAWYYVYTNCPAAYKNTFIFAPNILEAKIKATSDPAQKQQYIDVLIGSYKKRMEVFPGNEGYVLASEALDELTYVKDAEVAYKTFKRAYELNGFDLPAAAFNGMFISAARMYNDKKLDMAGVFEVYNIVSEAIEKNNNNLNNEIATLQLKRDSTQDITEKETKDLEKAVRELERFETVDANVEKVLAPIATCDKLNLLYNKETFAANKTNATWLRRAAKMLQKERVNANGEAEDCTGNPLFYDIATALNALEPSATSARAVAALAFKNGDYSKSVSFYNQAIGLDPDPKKKATDYLKMATAQIKTGSLAAAKASCLKAASLRPGWGDPYLLLAQIYGSAEGACGDNVFEKKAVYWAAVDKARYAKSIDPSVAGKADKLINAYSKAVPPKDLSFQLGHKEGERYTIGCWINETVTVAF
jgi:tetratricopeptide (TPR) repeat protein